MRTLLLEMYDCHFAGNIKKFFTAVELVTQVTVIDVWQ
jgi:hypothetical protein